MNTNIDLKKNMLDREIPGGTSQIAAFCGSDIELYFHSSRMKKAENERRAIYFRLLIHPNWAFCGLGVRLCSG
jgi:hypothetical protein